MSPMPPELYVSLLSASTTLDVECGRGRIGDKERLRSRLDAPRRKRIRGHGHLQLGLDLADGYRRLVRYLEPWDVE